MKHGEKMLVCMLAGVAFCTPANAITAVPSGSPYQGIIDRNVFGLKPAPPPPDPAEMNKPQAVKITLTGITTILGNKRALMKTPPPPAKPGEQSKGEQSYILTEGQREGDIEVLQIDEVAGSVKVNNAGTIVTLTFEKDGPKLPSSPAPGSPPSPMPPPPMGGPARPTNPAANTYTPPPPTGANSGVAIPSRIPRLPGTGASSTTTPMMGSGLAYSSPNVTAGGTTLPGFGTPIPQAQSAAAQNVPSHEEQMIMMEIEREMHKDDPHYPPPPPTPLTPSGMYPGAPPAPGGPPGGGTKQQALQ